MFSMGIFKILIYTQLVHIHVQVVYIYMYKLCVHVYLRILNSIGTLCIFILNLHCETKLTFAFTKMGYFLEVCKLYECLILKKIWSRSRCRVRVRWVRNYRIVWYIYVRAYFYIKITVYSSGSCSSEYKSCWTLCRARQVMTKASRLLRTRHKYKHQGLEVNIM